MGSFHAVALAWEEEGGWVRDKNSTWMSNRQNRWARDAGASAEDAAVACSESSAWRITEARVFSPVRGDAKGEMRHSAAAHTDLEHSDAAGQPRSQRARIDRACPTPRKQIVENQVFLTRPGTSGPKTDFISLFHHHDRAAIHIITTPLHHHHHNCVGRTSDLYLVQWGEQRTAQNRNERRKRNLQV